MDVANPLRSIAPTVDADVLAVLARTHAPLTGGRVHQLAGRSYAQVREVLHRLVAHGLVDAVRHGNTVSYSLNREHVLVGAIEAVASAGDEFERRLRTTLGTWAPAPVAAVLFGSFARRDGSPDSDVDLLIIRPDGLDDDDPAWAEQRYDSAQQVERWTGNTAQIVELTPPELDDAVARGDALIAALRGEGRVLIGPSLRSLLGGSSRKAAR